MSSICLACALRLLEYEQSARCLSAQSIDLVSLPSTRVELAFAYHPAYVKTGKPALSLSLPLQDKPYKGVVVEAFFAGLLPDESRRLELARVLGVSAANSFSLLEIVGGECAGAVSLYPVGSSPPPV